MPIPKTSDGEPDDEDLLSIKSALAETHAGYNNVIKPLVFKQFLNHWPLLQTIDTPEHKWGDEMEFMLIRFLHATKTGDNSEGEQRPRVVAPVDLQPLRERAVKDGIETACWSAEFASFQAETCPPEPYDTTETLDNFLKLEHDLKARQEFFREKLLLPINQEVGNKTDDLLFLTQLPVTGMPHFTDPDSDCASEPKKYPYNSIFFDMEKGLSDHTISRCGPKNLRQRRLAQPYFYVPIFRDSNTPQPFIEDLVARYGERNGSTVKYVQPRVRADHIVLEGINIGGCQCSMQVTQQLRTLQEASYVYDQLATLSPLFMALTAAAPFCRGYLSAWDSRWEVLAQQADTRTPAQRGDGADGEAPTRVGYARIHSIEMYMSEDSVKFNDLPQAVDEEVLKQILSVPATSDSTSESGPQKIPTQFARYLSHLTAVEPIIDLRKYTEKENENTFGVFSFMVGRTQYSTVRLKPPILESNNATNTTSATVKAGWRVEFRPMGVQSNAFQCSAFLVFVVLLTRAILHYKIDLRIRVSLIEKNIEEAIKIGAYRTAKFWCRKLPEIVKNSDDNDDSMAQLTASEIVCGKRGVFFGLAPLVEQYLKDTQEKASSSLQTRARLAEYVEFVRARAQGQEPTVAEWMRNFVRQHSQYKHDSVVPDGVIYDMMQEYRKFQL